MSNKNRISGVSKEAQLPPIKTRIIWPIRQVRLVPKGNHYILEIVYKKPLSDLKLNPDRVISIDLGVNNLVTVVNNAGLMPWRVKGGVIKSINQYYNKEKTRLTSLRDKQGLKILTNRLQRLLLKRKNKIADFFHKVSSKIISYCEIHGFGRIVLGYNKMWKQNICLSRQTNQNFVSIPFSLLVRQIQYKAEMVGIELILVDESHTSKVSFLDDEPIRYHQSCIGKRIQRGLFRSAKGRIINADVNGGYNSGRKAVPEAFKVDGIEGVGLHPDSVTV